MSFWITDLLKNDPYFGPMVTDKLRGPGSGSFTGTAQAAVYGGLAPEGMDDPELACEDTVDNAIGNHLMDKLYGGKERNGSKSPRGIMWERVNIGDARTCSPTVHSRVEQTVLDLYGPDSEEYRKISSKEAYWMMQGAYGKVASAETRAKYPLSDLDWEGVTEEKMHDLGYLAALEYAGLPGEFMDRDDGRANDFLFNGSLKPGAILGMNIHTGIFVEYKRSKSGKILGLVYWDDTNELRTWYIDPQKRKEVGEVDEVRPTKAFNFGSQCVDDREPSPAEVSTH
jgi:hypothetical protein